MRIALLHYSAPPIVGGVESVMAHHARLVVNAGDQVTMLTGRGKPFDERIPVRILPLLDSRHPAVLDGKTQLDKGTCPPFFDELRDQIKQELVAELYGYNLLIAHNVASLHKNLPLTAALYDIYTKPGFPRLILWHHDIAWTTPRYLSEMHVGYPWEGAWHVVVSALRRLELENLLRLHRESIRVIPNGVDILAFFKLEPQTIQQVDQLNLLDANPLFLLPVRLTPRKNIELALRVLTELLDGFPGAMLLVTGPEGPYNPANAAYQQNLLRLRDELNLRERAHFLAEVTTIFTPDPVIADFYRLADALLLSSREEGFGIPMIEAAFSSLPVFCSDIPVLRELGGEDVSYFDPDGAPNVIAGQIADQLNKEATSRWARRAKRGYTWEGIYGQYITPLLQEVTG